MYAVIHGGVSQELRKKSVDFLTALPFDGYAVGGSLGKTKQEMFELLQFTMPRLPEEKPNHLLGIGDLTSLAECIPYGVDTFDSSYPTRAARHGILFSKQGNINITKREYSTSFGALDTTCSCPTCKSYSAAYLHHLFKAKEMLAATLATIHNLRFMMRMMEEIRVTVNNGTYKAYRAEFESIYQ